MATYMESEIPTVIQTGNGNNGNGWGNGDGWWILLLLLFAGGNNGFGWGGRGGNNNELFGYQIGQLATTNDVASGFNNSAVLGSLNDLKLGQAGIQQTLCQGFNGVNTTVLQGFHGVDNAVCNLGYQISDCCCKTQGAIADLKYANERQTCDIINAINCGNQRIIDMYTNDKIDTLNRKLAVAENQLSQANQNAFITANQQAQTAELIRRLGRDCPVPAFVVPNPNCCYNPCGCSGNNFGGFSVQ